MSKRAKEVVLSISKGMAFFGLITFLFTVLKLTGIISWSWIWVFAPLWMVIGLFLLLIIMSLLGVGLISLLAWLFSKK